MRVLLVSGEYPPDCGGVADYTREIARALRELGVKVRVLTGRPSLAGELAPSPRGDLTHSPSTLSERGARGRRGKDDLEPSRLASPGVGEAGEGGCPSDESWPISRVIGSWGLRGLPALRREVLAVDCDIVHIQYQTAAYRMGAGIDLLPRLLRGRRRTVVTMHDLRVPYLFPKAGVVRTLANRTLVTDADAAILTNEADYAATARWRREGRYLIPIGSNIAVAPPAGYDRDAFRRALGLGPDEMLVGYFGLLNASKGIETLIDAIAQVRRQGIGVRLVLIGDEVGAADPTNAGTRVAVLAQVERLGLGSAVVQTGRLPAPMVSAYLLALDLCALPFRDGASFRRGSLMAALAHGLPILTTRPPDGSPAPLRDEREALLVPPDDPVALAVAIARALTAAVLRTQIAAGARRVGDRFTWPAIARQTLQVYEEIV